MIDYLGGAKYYLGMGFSPIPLNRDNKSPRLGEGYLETYSKRPPTAEEVERWFPLHSDENLGMGIIPRGDVVSLDVDDKILWPLIFSKAPEDKAKETWVHSTPRGWRTFVKDPAGIIKSKVTAPFPGEHRGIELKPSGAGYVVAPPTPGYAALNTPGQSIQTLKGNEARILIKTVQLFGRQAKIIDEVVKKWTPGDRQNTCGPLAGYLRKECKLKKEQAEMIVETICRLAGDTEIKQRLSYVEATYKKKLKEIAGWSALKEFLPYLKDEEPSKKREGVAKGPEEKEEEKEAIVYVPNLITDDFIAEEIYDHPNPPQFVIYNFKDGSFSYEDEIRPGKPDERGREIVCRPVYNDHVKKGMVILPRKPVECTIGDVIKESIAFVRSGYDPIENKNELILVDLSAISSWFLDKEKPSIPISGIGVFAVILPIRGPSGAGKNRLGNMLRFLSYHPFFDVSTHRIPSLFRPLDIWKGTLVIDEGDFGHTGENSELIHFLNSRATGTPIGRQNPDKPSQCDAFESFGITIITQRRNFEDNATEGRSIPFFSDVSEEKLPTLETDDMIKRGMDLQDKWLYIRMRHWKEMEIDKAMWVEGVTDHRFNSALLPIMPLGKFVPWIHGFVKGIIAPIERERRKMKAQSEDGVVVNSLWDRIDRKLFGEFNRLYYFENKERNKEARPLTTSKLAKGLGFTPKRLRAVLTSLNIAPVNAPPQIRVGKRIPRPVFFDPVKMEKRIKEFVIDYEVGKLYERLGIKPPVPDVPHVPDYFTGVSATKPPDLKPPSPSDLSISPERISGTSGTSGTLGTREKIAKLLELIDCLEDESGAANLDRLEDMAEKEGGIDRSEFGGLIVQMLRKGLIVKTEDEQAVRRAGPKPPADETVTEAPAGPTIGAKPASPTCVQCEKHHKEECVRENPELITDDAIYARDCKGFVMKGEG